MFMKKNEDALDAIETIFQNLNLDDSGMEKPPNKEDFFDWIPQNVLINE